MDTLLQKSDVCMCVLRDVSRTCICTPCSSCTVSVLSTARSHGPSKCPRPAWLAPLTHVCLGTAPDATTDLGGVWRLGSVLPSYGNQASGARTWPGVMKHLVQSKCPISTSGLLGTWTWTYFSFLFPPVHQGAHSLPAPEACHFLNTLHTFLPPSFCARWASPPLPSVLI